MHTHIPDDLAAIVESVAASLSPNVVRIRYTVGVDWSGEPAIHFRVLLSDEAASPAKLRESTHAAERWLTARLDFGAMGVWAYFNYRSQSEQTVMAGLSDWKEWE